MKRIILTICLLSAAFLFPQADIMDISRMEQKGKSLKTSVYPGDPGVDVKYYKLDLTVTTQPNFLTGKATINLTPLSPTNSFYLELSAFMIIDSLLINGVPAAFTRNQRKLTITLSRIYNPAELISAYIVYKGQPQQSGFGSFTFNNHGGVPIVSTLSEPYGAPDWFPVKDTPADKADSCDIWITCSSQYYAVSNGLLKEQITNGNGTTTYKWKSVYPIAQYLIAFAFTNYTIYTNYFKYTETDSMPVVHYAYPESFNISKPMMDKTPWMLKVFSDAFDIYPFINEKYGQAQWGWGGGMEHQTVSFISSFDEGLMVHELAHQWFGDKITNRDWHHIWLNEGFATWCTAYYMGQTYGPNSYSGFISNSMISAKNANGTIWVQDTTSLGEIFSGSRSYNKGAVVLHMLKGVTGDSVFMRIMRAYSNNPNFAYSTAVTEDFKEVAESLHGQDLDYFFNQWIYGEKYPKYNLNWNYNIISGNSYKVTLNVSQSPNTNPLFFTMPVQVKITTTTGDTLVKFFNNAQSQQVEFTVNGRPLDLIFDPNNYILKDLNLTSAPDDIISKTFSLEQNYPNPFNPSTRISFTVPFRSHVTLKVFDVLGNEVAVLINETRENGYYSEEFTIPSGISSGIYFYTLSSEDFTDTKKMMILK